MVVYSPIEAYEPASAADLRKHYCGVIRRNRAPDWRTKSAASPIVVVPALTFSYTADQARAFMTMAHATLDAPDNATADRYPLAAILNACCAASGTSVAEARGERRMRYIVVARQAFSYIAYETTNASLPQIGRHIGGCDHSTIHYGVSVARKQMREGKGLVRNIILRAYEILEGRLS
jgi:hypothetical protein